MEHLFKIMRRKWNIWANLWNSKIKYNGEETKYKSFVAKDTAKERYPKLLFVNLTAALLALFFLYA